MYLHEVRMTPIASPCHSLPSFLEPQTLVVPRNDAGVVYVASLLFDDPMMVLLAKHAEKLRKGARVISLKPIPAMETSGAARGPSSTVGVESDGDGGAAERCSRGLQLLHEGVFRMSWQMARVYIYLRI